MRPGLQIRHFWVAKSLFLTITFYQKKAGYNFLLLNNCLTLSASIVVKNLD